MADVKGDGRAVNLGTRVYLGIVFHGPTGSTWVAHNLTA